MKKSIKLSLTGLSVAGLAVGTSLATQNLKKSPVQQNIQAPKKGTKKAISEWLKSKANKTILLANDVKKDVVWGEKWKKFKDWYEQNSNNSNWKIDGWTTKKNDVYGYNEFKDLCKTNSQKETDDQDTLVDEVILHCVES